MIAVRVQLRMRSDDNLGLVMLKRSHQIRQQIAPTGHTIGITWQRQGIVSPHAANIRFTGLTRTERLIRLRLHRRQLQAVIAKLQALALRHTAPQRYRQAVPGAQTALELRSSRLLQPQFLVGLSFNFALREGQYADLTRPAV